MFIEVQLAETYKDYPNKAMLYRGSHILEPKIDGLRSELTNDGIYSRYGNKWGFIHDTIAKLTDFIGKLGFHIDGEFDYIEHDSKGNLLPHYDRRRLALSTLKRKVVPKERYNKIVFVAFDIIPLNGNLKLKDRKTVLSRVIPALRNITPFKIIENPFTLIKSQKEFEYWFNFYVKRGYEGIMLKNFNALYNRKRTSDWLKAKHTYTSDLPIIRVESGTKGKKNENKMGVLVVKTPQGEAEIGTGYPETGLNSRDYFWVHRNTVAGMVVEVTHEGYANGKGNLINAAFKGVRMDKPKWEMSF